MTKFKWNSSTELVFRNPAVVDQDQSDDETSKDENNARGNWTSKREYILSMIGFAVGLGNIWRFPYLAYKNGGGAFLIPYFIMLAVTGIPLFFLESALGQFCSQGPVNVWRAVPMLQGAGLAMLLVNTFTAVYYAVIIAYSVYYMFASFQAPLPWSGCLSWADGNCSTKPTAICNLTSLPLSNWTKENGTCPPSGAVRIPVQSPTEQYWDDVVLQRSSGLDETGPVVWHLALCLLLTLTLTAGALFKGIKSSGKVVYFTAVFPYVVLTVLLIRGVTLEGARDGIDFYIGSQSNITKLWEAEVWRDAATQTFYSLSIAFGGVIALSSYSKFHNNLFQDTFVVTLTNAGTSVLAGFAIFSILGHMAHVYGKPVGEVAKGGFALAFIVYPDALIKLPISPLWAVLFFFMLVVLGLDSEFAFIEVITTCLLDGFPQLKSKRSLITVVTCATIFLLGLLCVTRAGLYWVILLDQFAASWVTPLIALIELVGVVYIYGGNCFIQDIEMMIGPKSRWFWVWWKACWFVISPCVLTIIFVWSLVSFKPPSYGTVQFPAWSMALGWCISAFCLLWIPVFAVYKLYRAEGGFWKRLKTVCSPSKDWHPYLGVHRGQRYSEERCRHRIGGLTLPDSDINVFSSSQL